MSVPVLTTEYKELQERITRPIRAELDRVDEILHVQLSSSVKTVAEVSTHLLEAGGKRLRPALVLLCAKTSRGECDEDRLLEVAASTELLHMATLMHDDVIDSADSRRGRETANHRWGSHVSVLSGDFLLARAFMLLSRNADARIIQTLARTTSAMGEGEIRQMETRGNTEALSSGYESIIRGKTAEFISACCRLGAIVAGCTPEIEDAVGCYGLNVGMAFQITDDLLDLTGNPALTGKPIGADVREGKLTLPVIHALAHADPAETSRIEGLYKGGEVTTEEIEWLCAFVARVGALDSSRLVAQTYIDLALGSLADFPDSESRASLHDLARSIPNRTN